MAEAANPSVARKVVRYLADRIRDQQGCWISVADVRGALAIDPEEIRTACLALHARGLAELMGGFPIRPTTEGFTLVRLSPDGVRLVSDPRQVDALLAEGG